MFRHAGARSLLTGTVIERNPRSVVAAAQHGLINESVYEIHGQVVLGFEEVAPIS